MRSITKPEASMKNDKQIWFLGISVLLLICIYCIVNQFLARKLPNYIIKIRRLELYEKRI